MTQGLDGASDPEVVKAMEEDTEEEEESDNDHVRFCSSCGNVEGKTQIKEWDKKPLPFGGYQLGVRCECHGELFCSEECLAKHEVNPISLAPSAMIKYEVKVKELRKRGQELFLFYLYAHRAVLKTVDGLMWHRRLELSRKQSKNKSQSAAASSNEAVPVVKEESIEQQVKETNAVPEPKGLQMP